MLERPSKLVSYRFDQLADQINKRVMPDEADVERYVGLEHLDPDSLRIRRWGDTSEVESTKLLFQPGDIIFGKRRVYQRKVAVADFEGICSAHAMVLRAKPETVLPEFLPFFMQSDLFMERALSISVGSLSPTINWKALAKEEFLLPPIQEQARVVEVLSAFDASIEGLYAALENAQIVWRSLSRDEFGPRANRGGLLADHYSVQSGQVDPKDEEYKHLPLVGPNHIEQVVGIFLGADSAEDQSAISGKYLFEPDTVIYSKIRPELRKAFISDFRGLCSADMYPLIAGPDILPKYLLDLVLSDAFSAYAISCSMRTGMPKLNRDQLSRFEFDLPDVVHQTAYVSSSEQIKDQSKEISNRLAKIIEMKKMTVATLFQ